MVTEALEKVLSESFLDKASHALDSDGFVTDEHDFAPYRETIAEYVSQIQEALRQRGRATGLASGFVRNHPDAGYAYFIYDTARFDDLASAQDAVSRWLSELYVDNQNA